MGSSTDQLHRLHRFGYAQDADDALEVVCEHLKAHFSAHVFDPAGEEVRRVHPVLECSEHVFDRAPSNRHLPWPAVQPRLQPLKDVLMLPASHAAFLAHVHWGRNAHCKQASLQ